MTAPDDDVSLFPGFVVPFVAAPAGAPDGEPLSAGRRLTLRQRADIARGRHPLTGGPVNADGDLKCGNCAHRLLAGYQGRTYAKCAVGRQSRGPATDVRAWWPGCANHLRRG